MLELVKMQQRQPETDFTEFVRVVEPRLRRALIGAVGADRTHDAVAHALMWAWENWSEVEPMANPAGYLYRVARSSLRERQPTRVRFLVDDDQRIPDVEPELVPALKQLPEQQRTCVWLAHACGWTHPEISEALDISTSSVSTHVNRALAALRSQIGTSGQ